MFCSDFQGKILYFSFSYMVLKTRIWMTTSKSSEAQKIMDVQLIQQREKKRECAKTQIKHGTFENFNKIALNLN